MLQLATLPTRGASGALDLLITRAVEQHMLGSSTLPKVGSDRLGGHHLQFQSRRAATRSLLIGAGYMIVDNLFSVLAGLA